MVWLTVLCWVFWCPYCPKVEPCSWLLWSLLSGPVFYGFFYCPAVLEPNVLKGWVETKKCKTDVAEGIQIWGLLLPISKMVKTFSLIRRTIFKRASSITSLSFGLPLPRQMALFKLVALTPSGGFQNKTSFSYAIQNNNNHSVSKNFPENPTEICNDQHWCQGSTGTKYGYLPDSSYTGESKHQNVN